MTLLTQLQSATEGNRALDAEIAATLGGMLDQDWKDPRWHDGGPRYTTNLQDAVSLISEGWEWQLEWQTNPDIAICRIGDPSLDMTFEAPTPPLAVCRAAIEAHRSKTEA